MSDHSTKAPVKKGIYRRGNMAAIALAVITIVEFILAATFEIDSAVVMFLLAIMKAYIIMNIFMGITRLWNEEDHH